MCPRSRTAVWLHLDIASMPYEKARQLQLAVVDAKGGDGGLADVVIFLEHPPVFTLGRRGRRDHLKVTQAFLEAHGLSLIHTERGGDVTYHGPGQLVSYPVVDLRANGWRVVDFVAAQGEPAFEDSIHERLQGETSEEDVTEEDEILVEKCKAHHLSCQEGPIYF